jgi:hypothetical protein
MCNGTTFPAWEASCIRKLLDRDEIEPALLIIDEEATNLSGKWSKLKKPGRLLWYLYRLLLVKRFSRAERPVDLSEEFSQVPRIRCRVRRKGRFSQYFKENDLAKIREHDLDFVLRFAFNIIRGEILRVPRFGVWSFHHGDEERYRGSPPCFWEVYRNDNVTGAILQRLTNKLDAGVVLKKGFFKTVNTSYTRNRDRTFFESADWPAQVCVDIRNGHTEHLEAAPSRTSAPILYPPGNLQMVGFAFRVLGHAIKRSTVFLLYDHWNIGIVDSPIHAFLDSGFRPKVEWLGSPGPSRFLADPFAANLDGMLHVLYEDFDYAISRGRISAITVTGGRTSQHGPVLESSNHMAYPFLLKHEGAVYCVPETSEDGVVGLYEAGEIPVSWRRVCNLLEGYAGVDNTVFHHGGLWWLFNTDEKNGVSHRLNAWYSEDLRGPWKPHAANPVKVDVRSARPAGTPFVHGGELYRPAQDCSRTYGGSVVINRVTRLSPTEFHEESVAFVKPDPAGPWPDGLHTLSSAGGKTVIDGLRKRFTLSSLAVIGHKLRRIRMSLLKA